MSKLERQIDEIENLTEFVISWPPTAGESVAEIEKQLRVRVDQAVGRVPLDLRKVSGAPRKVVDLILDLNEYAESKGKRLSISHALQPMREALLPSSRRNLKRPSESDPEQDASKAAEAVLGGGVIHQGSLFYAAKNSNNSLSSTGKPEEISVASRRVKRYLESFQWGCVAAGKWMLFGRTLPSRIVRLLGMAAVGTSLLVFCYWVFLTNFADDSYRFKPIRKNFEDAQTL
ncbi:MAG: hypothetical protein ACE361_21100 [Aureliella sp.]